MYRSGKQSPRMRVRPTPANNWQSEDQIQLRNSGNYSSFEKYLVGWSQIRSISEISEIRAKNNCLEG